METVFPELRQKTPLEQAVFLHRQAEQDMGSTAHMTRSEVVWRKMVQLRYVKDLPFDLDQVPCLLVGTIPYLRNPRQLPLIAARFNMEASIVIRPEPQDTVVNLKQPHGWEGICSCNIWKACPELWHNPTQYGAIVFNYIPLPEDFPSFQQTVMQCVHKLRPGGLLLVQTDILAHRPLPEQTQQWLKTIHDQLPGSATGEREWQQGVYGFLIYQRR